MHQPGTAFQERAKCGWWLTVHMALQGLEQRGVRVLPAPPVAASLENTPSRIYCPGDCLMQEPRLAYARLAGNQQQRRLVARW